MRPQVPLSMPKSRPQSPHGFAGQWQAPARRSHSKDESKQRAQDQPKTLGNILVNNHGVLNHIVDFDDFDNERNSYQFPTPSMTSSAELARAQASRCQSDEDKLPQVEYSVPMPEQSREPDQDDPREFQDNGIRQIPAERAPSNTNAVQYWEMRQDSDSNRYSAFQTVERNSLRSLPSNSLADEALASPLSMAEEKTVPFQCHDVANRVPVSTHAPLHPTHPPVQHGPIYPNSIQQGPIHQSQPQAPRHRIKASAPVAPAPSIFELITKNGIFPRSCTPSLRTCEDEPTQSRKSIWSYFDPNDDLQDYSIKSPGETSESSDEEGTIRRKKGRQRRRHKSHSPKVGSYRRAYEDLMLIDHQHEEKARNMSRTRQSKHTKGRSTTPNTIVSRSSITQSIAGTISDTEPPQQTSPTLRQLRKDLWGNVSSRSDAPTHARSNVPGRSSSKERSKRAVQYSTQKEKSLQAEKSRENRKTSQNTTRRRSRSREQGQERKKAFDPFGLGGDNSPPKRSQFDPGSQTQTTPRASNANLQNNNRRNTFSIKKRDTVPVRERSKSFTVDRRTSKKHDSRSEEKESNPFPFPPDFFMLDDPQHEARKSRSKSPIGRRREDHLSQLSDSDFSTIGAPKSRKQQQLLQLAKWKSAKNVEKLKRLEGREENFVPDFLPQGSEESNFSDDIPSFERTSNAATNYSATQREMGDVYRSSSGDSNSVREPRESEISRHPRGSERFDGHYMYVAYSRFGENAREVIQLCEHKSTPCPNARGGEVLVKVLASSISLTDCDIRRGEWSQVRLNPYIIPGVALVGTIHPPDSKRRTSGFSTFKPGDVVMAMVTTGANARYTCVSKDKLIKVPQNLSPNKTVCLAETYLAAFQALHLGQRGALRYRDNVFKGQSVLILGGSSSLGHALIEVAIAGGAEYCYALVKGRQVESINKLGGIPLPKDPQEWLTLIGRQIGLMIAVRDSRGMYTDPITREHLKALTEDGRVVFIGEPGVDHRPPNLASTSSPNKLICKSVKGSLRDRTHSYNVFDSWESDPKLAKRDLEHLIDLLQQDRIHPEVLERVPLSKVAKVQAILETKKITGYIVCAPWMEDSIAKRF